MLLEALVITACIQNKGGCSESTNAYYHSNKGLQTVVENAEQFGRRITKGNEWLVYVATPIYAVASGKPANFKLHKAWILRVDVKKELIVLQWSY